MTIAQGLHSGRPRFSFEFFPPKSDSGAKSLFETIAHLRPIRPLYVSVTYGAAGSSRDYTVELAGRIRSELGLETLAHLTCIDQSRSEIAQTMDALTGSGVRNVLALRGDPPNGSRAVIPDEERLPYAVDLVSFIRSRWDVCVGAACYPEGHIEKHPHEIDHLKAKVDAGAEFLITQLFFEAETYFRFLDQIRAAGIWVPVIPGLMPVTDIGQLKRFTEMCGATIPKTLRSHLERAGQDRASVVEVGILWSASQSMWLLANGAPGIHFYTLNRSHSTRIICERLQFMLGQTGCM